MGDAVTTTVLALATCCGYVAETVSRYAPVVYRYWVHVRRNLLARVNAPETFSLIRMRSMLTPYLHAESSIDCPRDAIR